MLKFMLASTVALLFVPGCAGSGVDLLPCPGPCPYRPAAHRHLLRRHRLHKDLVLIDGQGRETVHCPRDQRLEFVP